MTADRLVSSLMKKNPAEEVHFEDGIVGSHRCQIEALRLHDLRKDVVIGHVLLDDRRDTTRRLTRIPLIAAVSKVRIERPSPW